MFRLYGALGIVFGRRPGNSAPFETASPTSIADSSTRTRAGHPAAPPRHLRESAAPADYRAVLSAYTAPLARRPCRDTTELEAVFGPPQARRRPDTKVSGVAGSLADYLGIDAVLVRVGFVVTTLASRVGVLAYVALLALVARDDAHSAPHPPAPRTTPSCS